MPNSFIRSQDRYGGSTPQSSYHRAALIWDQRVGSSVVQARNWRVMAFGSLFMSFVTFGAYVYERQNTHIATYVVPINEYGRPGRIELAARTYSPTAAETEYFIADWVRLVRSKPTDAVVLRQNWSKAYHFLTPETTAELDGFARTNNPFDRVGQEAVTVDVASVLARSPHTYQINWRETDFDPGGRPTLSNWTGLFTTVQRQPTNEVELRNNPLGLFIASYQWSKEL